MIYKTYLESFAFPHYAPMAASTAQTEGPLGAIWGKSPMLSKVRLRSLVSQLGLELYSAKEHAHASLYRRTNLSRQA
ncbi:hypothetical protein C8J98_102320 [Luteibacter sp. OK325]|nr:hypothetical protein C8J98_102320 [Luteibacter sp. OK325]